MDVPAQGQPSTPVALPGPMSREPMLTAWKKPELQEVQTESLALVQVTEAL